MNAARPLLGFLAVSLATCGATAATSAQDSIVFAVDFENPEVLRQWSGGDQPGISLERTESGSMCLRVERPAATKADALGIRTRLPLEKFRGTRVRVQAMVRAESVSRPPNPWNGIECMVYTAGPGGTRWDQQNSVFGTFAWKPVRFVTEIPADTTEAWLTLGLEQTTGCVWFDDVQISIVGARRSVPEQQPAEPAHKGHHLPRLRGAMIGPHLTAADLDVLGGQWKANHIRWQLIWGGFPHSPADRASVSEYREWLASALDRLDQLLPPCRKLGIKVLIDLHTPPGGRNDAKECRIFHDGQFQEAFVDAWRMIAQRYRGDETIWGYDLVNEPVEGVVAEGLMNWSDLATHTAREIREIDPACTLVVEPAPWGSPSALDWFQPLDLPRIVYSVHMYQPHAFTHQGVYDSPTGIVYPGLVDGKLWDRQALRKVLQPVIDYQRDYNVHIYIGEFSAIRWAPGESAHDYLRDCIEIFEQQGWDWAYHAFREWDGWSVEHGPDRQVRSPSPAPTRRQQLLRSWFERNLPARDEPQ